MIDFKYYCYNINYCYNNIFNSYKLIMNTFQFSNMIHHKTKYPKEICEMITNYIFNTQAVEDVPFEICGIHVPIKSDNIKTVDTTTNLQSKYKKYYFVEFERFCFSRMNVCDNYERRAYVFDSIEMIYDWVVEMDELYKFSHGGTGSYSIACSPKYNSIVLKRIYGEQTGTYTRIICKNKSEFNTLSDKIGKYNLKN